MGEDGTGGSVVVSESGYSFGDVRFTLRPLTYSQFVAGGSSLQLDMLIPLRPRAAASGERVTQPSWLPSSDTACGMWGFSPHAHPPLMLHVALGVQKFK